MYTFSHVLRMKLCLCRENYGGLPASITWPVPPDVSELPSSTEKGAVDYQAVRQLSYPTPNVKWGRASALSAHGVGVWDNMDTVQRLIARRVLGKGRSQHPL